MSKEFSMYDESKRANDYSSETKPKTMNKAEKCLDDIWKIINRNLESELMLSGNDQDEIEAIIKQHSDQQNKELRDELEILRALNDDCSFPNCAEAYNQRIKKLEEAIAETKQKGFNMTHVKQSNRSRQIGKGYVRACKEIEQALN